MKAISVRQPWAWLILYAGKDIENRTWATNHRGPLLIHAGQQRPTRADMEWCAAFRGKLSIDPPPKEALEYGAIVGQVELVDCVTQSKSCWWQGPVGWQLAKPKRMRPRPIAGRLGLFEVDL